MIHAFKTCKSNIKANVWWTFYWNNVFAKVRKGHNMLIIYVTILPYKISISWSNSPYYNKRTITTWHSYSFLIVPMTTKTINNALNNIQYLLHWLNRHWWTIGSRVSITAQAIAHVKPLGTLVCKDEFHQTTNVDYIGIFQGFLIK